MSIIRVSTAVEADNWIDSIGLRTIETIRAIKSSECESIELFYQLKFEQTGRHPTEGHTLNFVEQLNQTWTYLCAFLACKHLFALHPNQGGFLLAPGAKAVQSLDIMSLEEGLIGAETFAAVDPKNNRKLSKDISKMKCRAEKLRYVFMLPPKYPSTSKVCSDEGVEVWSLWSDFLPNGLNK